MSILIVSSKAGDNPNYTNITDAIAGASTDDTIQIKTGDNAGEYYDVALNATNCGLKNLTIEPYAGATIVLKKSATGNCLIGSSADGDYGSGVEDTTVVTFSDITFDGTGASYYIVNIAGGKKLTFTDCIFQNNVQVGFRASGGDPKEFIGTRVLTFNNCTGVSAANGRNMIHVTDGSVVISGGTWSTALASTASDYGECIIFTATAAQTNGGDLTIVGGTFTPLAGHSVVYAFVTSSGDLDDISVADATFVLGTTGIGIRGKGVIGSIKADGVTFTGNATPGATSAAIKLDSFGANAATCDFLIVRDCIIGSAAAPLRYGVYAPSCPGFDYIEIKDNTINVDYASGASYGALVGYANQWNGTYTTYRGFVSGNTVACGDYTNSLAILVGMGCDGFFVENNTITGGAKGIVLSGRSILLTGNIVTANTALIIQDGQGNSVISNSFYGVGHGNAFYIINNELDAANAYRPRGSIIYNNIFACGALSVRPVKFWDYERSIDSIARSSNTVTVDTTYAHGLATGDVIDIEEVSTATLNASDVTITVTDADTFTYTDTGDDESDTDGVARTEKGYHWDTYIDYNCYVAAASNPHFMYLDGVEYSDMNTLRTKWETTGDFYEAPVFDVTLNDQHSIGLVNDQMPLINPAGGDFRLKASSACLNLGKPSISGKTSIGTWSPKGVEVTGRRQRYNGETIYS